MDWTKVTDALPPEMVDVLMTILHPDGQKEVTAGWHDGDGFYCGKPYEDDEWEAATVTHWAPMPAPAEDEEDLL